MGWCARWENTIVFSFKSELYSTVRTKEQRRKVKYIVCLGMYGKSSEPLLAIRSGRVKYMVVAWVALVDRTRLPSVAKPRVDAQSIEE